MNDDDEPLSDMALTVLEEQADADDTPGGDRRSVVLQRDRRRSRYSPTAPPSRVLANMKQRTAMRKAHSRTVDKVSQLETDRLLTANERDTDAADLETMLRIIQSIPSPKAEPIKLWLAKVGCPAPGDARAGYGAGTDHPDRPGVGHR